MSTIDTDLKGVSHVGNYQYMNSLETGIRMFFDWGFLRIGAWDDIVIPTTSEFSGDTDLSKLRLVKDRHYTDGKVWEGFRKDWVWEQDVDYLSLDTNTYNPKAVSIQVDGSPVASSEYIVNYPLGRIIFNTEISTTSVVKAQFSYRNIQTYIADEAEWWRELQYRSHRADDNDFGLTDTGEFSITANHRIQMPCVVFECVPRTQSRGYQLGDGGYWVAQDVLAFVLAENRFTRNDITDIILRQFNKTIYLPDINQMREDSAFPLNSNGDIVDATKTYKNLVNNAIYQWKKCFFKNTSSSEIESINPNLHMSQVRLTLEVPLDD